MKKNDKKNERMIEKERRERVFENTLPY